MLTGIGLRNFKAFGEGPNVLAGRENGQMDWTDAAPLSKITLIYGPNSGGKSSIIQALLLLKQSLKTSYVPLAFFNDLEPRGDFFDFGSFSALIHRHDKRRELGIKLRYRNDTILDHVVQNEVLTAFSVSGAKAPEKGNFVESPGETFKRDSMSAAAALTGVGLKITSFNSDEALFDAQINLTSFVPYDEASEWRFRIMGIDGNVRVGMHDHFLPLLCLPEMVSLRKGAIERVNVAYQELKQRYESRLFGGRRIDSHIARKIDLEIGLEKTRQLGEDLIQANRLSNERSSYLNEIRDDISNRERELDLLKQARSDVSVAEQGLEWSRETVLELDRIEQRERELKNIRWLSWQINALSPEIIPDRFETYLHSVKYLGPLRSAPQRLYKKPSTSSGESVGTQGEFSSNVLYTNERLGQSVNQIFGQFEIPYELSLIPIGEASLGGEDIAIALYPVDKEGKRVKDGEGKDVAVTIADVGYGINQLLPVIIEGIASQEGSILCVEQPEIHLHPRLQANIADLMIDTIADEPGKRKQWIVETHSELLIRRIRTCIAQGDISPSDVSVLYVDPDDEDCEGSAIKELRLDGNGRFLDEWPNGFFEEGYKQARLARRARLAKDNKDAGKVRN